MNPRIDRLPPYPFERLRDLLKDLTPPTGLTPISLGIGEPRHPAPPVFLNALADAAAGFSTYPTTQGEPAHREAIAAWLCRRFRLGAVDPERQVLPCAGTREALFSFAQAVVGRPERERVLIPNPFYQIYEGAALWAGATPHFVDATTANGFLPDYAGLPEEVLARTSLLYLCTPANPTGRVAPRTYLQELIALADRHDFVIASDECYSELYPDENAPPCGLLEAAQEMGNERFERCVVFHSLSKRSNLPGARVGFVAGDAALLARYARLRTYTGSTVPPPIQRAAAATWGDEDHVRANRDAYREKFRIVLDILGPVLKAQAPDAGFYLWLRVPGGGEAFCRRLYAECAIKALPGRYLARPWEGDNPGSDYVRMALVDTPEMCREAATRIRDMV